MYSQYQWNCPKNRGLEERSLACTGFYTDCLHPAPTVAYWPLRGRSLEVIEVKGRRFSIRSLQRINRVIGLDGVSANSTTSAFKINKLHSHFLARQNICQVSLAK